ncbi:MAG: hypothetical protein GXO15_04390 [Crenarchaeota archaeon]|nr:hypothetical protein [Thermoproteota archaeon]
MSRAEARVKVYRSVDELPEVLEPGRYLVEDLEVELREPMSREELVYQLRKTRELVKKFGREGWV